MLKKVIIVCCLVFVAWSLRASAEDTQVTVSGGSNIPSKLTSNIGGLSLGYIKVGSEEVATLAWHPDFKFGAWGLGADINMTLGEKRPSGYDNVVVRYVEYDDGKKGMRYGVVDNLTWGHGLLMKDYSSRIAGPVILDNGQLGIQGYVDMDKYVVRALKTGSNIYGLRAEERINPMLTLGQTFLTDADGVPIRGTNEVQKVTAFGVDASIPLPMNFEGYAEYAQLVDHGSGFNAGVSWAQDFLVANANFLAEYRFLDSKFIPGYFDSDYETNPISLASAEATGNVKNGYLAQLGVKAMDMAALKAVYEKYNDSDAALMADLFAKLPQNVELTYYYKQPKFNSFRALSLEEGAIIGGSLAYPVNPFTKVVVHYKKIYNPATMKVEESQYYELRLSF